jgi:hypothetical protein
VKFLQRQVLVKVREPPNFLRHGKPHLEEVGGERRPSLSLQLQPGQFLDRVAA